MHDILNSIILGIIEGLTEFLPVSSTGHLLVGENLLGLPDNRWEAFTIVIQFGAILSVVAVYWKKFWNVLIGLPTSPEARQFAINVLVAFIPAAILGATVFKYLKQYLLQPSIAMPFIGTCWLVGGVIILILERIAPKPRFTDGDNLPFAKALQIGFCQCLALIPGVSRSGATILGGEMLGVDRRTATEFTFYLAIPTMLGATVLDLWKARHELTTDGIGLIALGFVTAFVVAIPVVRGLIGFVGRFGLTPFAWYRIAIGIVAGAWLLLR